jgi:hypothetical protein
MPSRPEPGDASKGVVSSAKRQPVPGAPVTANEVNSQCSKPARKNEHSFAAASTVLTPPPKPGPHPLNYTATDRETKIVTLGLLKKDRVSRGMVGILSIHVHLVVRAALT